ncbi:MAG: hypothetical protein ABW131_13440 [Candidatus Sedimenticola sp. 6PFRAG5]
MRKYKPGSDEAVREAMDNLYRGTAIDRAMELTTRMRQEKNNRKMLTSFLLGRLNPEFLQSNTHVPALGENGDRSNEEAVVTWANRRIEENPEQLQEITSGFMVDTYHDLQEILIEHQYI